MIKSFQGCQLWWHMPVGLAKEFVGLWPLPALDMQMFHIHTVRQAKYA